MTNFLRLGCAAFTLLLILASGAALADPPARVGRLAYLENDVYFAVDRDDQGAPATLNWPISSGAILDTDRRGRAEVWVGSTAYRLAGSSRLEFVVVDDRQVTLDLNDGSLAISILDRDQVNDITVHTPDGSVRFVTPGRYRIDVLADHTELSAQAGQATIDYRGRVTPVSAGQKLSLSDGGQMRVEADFDQDTFDNWVGDRENVTMASVSRRHVSPHMTGYQDLDNYGDWRPVPEYGTVWYPRSVADDWAPYRFGRWAWVAPWGWTWIDQSPWGFAPFHYGRWVIIKGRWGWVPGSHVARPVYAPALVGWIGDPGWSVSFSFGTAPAVGWFPLAPREVYVPAYRYSPTYIWQINVSHVREVQIIERAARSGARENFAHRAMPQAVTVVPASLVREGRSIGAHEIRRSERKDLGRAPLATHAPDAEWLKPAPRAVRPHPDVRREQLGGRDKRRDAERSTRQMNNEPPAPAARAPMPAASEPERDARREMRETQRQERSAPRDDAPPVSRSPDVPTIAPAARMPQAVPSPAPDQGRDTRREMREVQRMERVVPRESASPLARPPQALPAAPAVRPPAQFVPPSAPEAREARREMREVQRTERAVQRDDAPPARQRERPSSAPPVQAAPQPPRAPQVAPPQAPKPEQRGGGDRENSRRGNPHGDDKGERGPH